MSPPVDKTGAGRTPGPGHLDVKRLLQTHNIRLKKGLGQNFLVSPAALERVVTAAGITYTDLVLEVGAGIGGLTRQLAARAGQVVAVELDPRLIPPLREVLEPFNNIRLIEADILDLDLADVIGESGFLVVSNIPYYITSALFRHLLEAPVKPARLVLTVQREVAERICAQPGKMNLLALSVQVYGLPQIAARIPAEAFYPVPKVESRVVRVDLYPEPRANGETLELYFRLANAGFGQRRKTLRNSLSHGTGWPKSDLETWCARAGIDPGRRAETLSVDEWIGLAEVVLGAG